MKKSKRFYLSYFLNTIQINLRDDKHKISIAKHSVFGVVIGLIVGIFIAAFFPDFFLPLFGKNMSCPIQTEGINLIGCQPQFMYLTELFAAIVGAAFGFIIGLLRKSLEKRSFNKTSIS